MSRVLTALVALPPVLFILWRGGWLAAGLFSLCSALATWEFLRMASGQLRRGDLGALAAATLLPLLPQWTPEHAAELALALIAFASTFVWVEHVLRQDVEGAATRAPATVQALIFCAPGLFFVSSLRVRPDGLMWVITLLAATFANDTAAFFGGKLLGRHRLAPRVSPGKTWEGFFAGALGSALAVIACKLWWSSAMGVGDAVVTAAVCSFFGPLGDLAKSLLKRARGSKDFGHLLPGHGGLLDRIDAMLVNATLLWAWVRFQ